MTKRPAKRAPRSSALVADQQAIRQTVENWVVWRDSGDWDRFATVWHPGAWMVATWFQGPATDFIEVSRQGFERGVMIQHSMGGWTCDIAGNRAISQTRMTIHQRGAIDGVLVDVSCMGRFYDFFEKRKGRWLVARRRLVYERDRLDPVDPAATIRLDPAILQRFPEGYRHLAYLQTKLGFTVKTGLPGLRGAAVDALYADGKAWLDGSKEPGARIDASR